MKVRLKVLEWYQGQTSPQLISVTALPDSIGILIYTRALQTMWLFYSSSLRQLLVWHQRLLWCLDCGNREGRSVNLYIMYNKWSLLRRPYWCIQLWFRGTCQDPDGRLGMCVMMQYSGQPGKGLSHHWTSSCLWIIGCSCHSLQLVLFQTTQASCKGCGNGLRWFPPLRQSSSERG